jgi:hypothetical protein
VTKPVIIINFKKPKNMKRLSFLFVAFALVSLFSLNSCKSSTEPAAAEETTVVEEAQPVAADTTVAPVEATTEEAAE